MLKRGPILISWRRSTWRLAFFNDIVLAKSFALSFSNEAPVSNFEFVYVLLLGSIM